LKCGCVETAVSSCGTGVQSFCSEQFGDLPAEPGRRPKTVAHGASEFGRGFKIEE